MFRIRYSQCPDHLAGRPKTHLAHIHRLGRNANDIRDHTNVLGIFDKNYPPNVGAKALTSRYSHMSRPVDTCRVPNM